VLDRRKTVWSIVAIFGLAACEVESRSAIVQKVETAGSGRLSNVSKNGMREWLAKHKDLAYQVNDMCNPKRSKATAQWADTTEGKLCSSARTGVFSVWPGEEFWSDVLAWQIVRSPFAIAA
jgi:hypothetical protein